MRASRSTKASMLSCGLHRPRILCTSHRASVRYSPRLAVARCNRGGIGPSAGGSPAGLLVVWGGSPTKSNRSLRELGEGSMGKHATSTGEYVFGHAAREQERLIAQATLFRP